jgi:predicted RND superfamily exporter protein
LTWKLNLLREDEEFFDPFDDATQEEDYNKYWFTDHRMEMVEKVHDYLDALPETGKVLSLGTLLKIGRRLNDGQSLDSIEMAVLYTKVPDEYKDLILFPFVSFENSEARFTIRIIDSMKSLKRDALLKKINHDLVHQLKIEKDKVRLSGTMVLYNNMLQSLFASQIKTLGFVALALLLMFLLLFRSIKVSLIALFPNIFSAGTVLGVMGWMNIPLDMMTITVAAISIGIAVDDTIHYIYRFQKEIITDGDYNKTLHRCHNTIGHAMYYTSLTIIIGFSILVLSNFWPTIYFGLFTSMAMLIALIASLTLLPLLLVLFKPFGPDAKNSVEMGMGFVPCPLPSFPRLKNWATAPATPATGAMATARAILLGDAITSDAGPKWGDPGFFSIAWFSTSKGTGETKMVLVPPFSVSPYMNPSISVAS